MKYLLLTANTIIGAALLLQVSATGEFDQNALTPASAGLAEQAREYYAEQVPEIRINCDAAFYRASMDAGSSGGAMLYVAAGELDFGDAGIDGSPGASVTAGADLEPETDVITNFALYLCDGEFIPSDAYLPDSGLLRMAYNPWTPQGGIKSNTTGVS